MGKVARALVSVFDKAGVVEFARQLREKYGVEILSTGGTARKLTEAGVDIVQVSDFTGAPEMFDGRVKTLHPKIEGGILYRRSNEKDVTDAGEYGIKPIDLVVCNLYPFAQVIARPETTLDDALEMIDIGGPTMIRAAAKNYHDVAVVVDPSDYETILREMEENDGMVSLDTRARLARKVFAVMSHYDYTVAKYLEGQAGAGTESDNGSGGLVLPDTIVKRYEKVQDCRYGENWDQEAAFYRDVDSRLGLADLKQLHGKEISFNNFLDIDACFQLLMDLGTGGHACVIFKHTTPNGAAIDDETQLEACKRAFSCDPLSAFGGIWGFNEPLGRDTADYIVNEKKVFVEVLLAPSFEPAALDILKTKQNLRIVELGDALGRREEAYENLEYRGVLGGVLVEEYDHKPVVKEWKVVSEKGVSDGERRALEFAYKISKWAKSNSAAFVRVYDTGVYTVGIGAGQQSRVHVVKLAASKAKEFGHDLAGSFMGTDSFFPFPDGLEAAADEGAVAIVNPGGSIRDEQVIKAANERGIALVFCGKRVFRH
ncbi:MAG: bifunctional phosphoribosylaminoimidazolecarboxamide formyltransferase/IMP cyclohydrolase [Promethearchaeota archaeon]